MSTRTASAVDHRELYYNAALTLAMITEYLDPALTAMPSIGGDGDINVQLYTDATIRDAARLADALGLTENTTSRSESDIHHAWSGSWEGFAVRVVWLEPLPAPVDDLVVCGE